MVTEKSLLLASSSAASSSSMHYRDVEVDDDNQSVISGLKDPDANSEGRRDVVCRRPVLVLGLMLMMLGVFSILITQYTNISSLTNGRFFMELGGYSGKRGDSATGPVSGSSSSSVTTTNPNGVSDISLSFTMARDGYSELPYFGDDASTVFKYQILADYDGILEPHAANNMVRYFTSLGNTHTIP